MLYFLVGRGLSPSEVQSEIQAAFRADPADLACVEGWWVDGTSELDDETVNRLVERALGRAGHVRKSGLPVLPAPRGGGFSPEERDELVAAFKTDRVALRNLPQGDDRSRAAAAQRMRTWRRTYAEGLPWVPVSRCPLSGDPVSHSFDPFGLDGFWWDADDPVRPASEPVPATFSGLTGAVRLPVPAPVTPFRCLPGPEVPFVVPQVLDRRGVVAVLCSVPLRDCQAWAITYFTETARHHLVASWGTRDAVDRAADAELEPWLESEKLSWIAPGDEGLELRWGTTGCPYLGLPGRREAVELLDGEVLSAPRRA